MRLNIKTKLRAGLLFLFAVIVLIGVLGGVFLYRLSDESKLIIKDNYETIVYTKGMTEACDQIAVNPAAVNALDSFEQNLKRQKKNITEPGEKEFTARLSDLFFGMKNDSASARARHLPAIRQTLHQVENVNLDAISRKNLNAGHIAHTVILWMTFIGTLAILLSFSFVLNFPDYIADPIRELTEGIKEIAARNYAKRLHFNRDDEFGELAAAFNSMTEKLEEYETSSLAKLLFEKKRVDTVISSMRDAIIGLDENGIILFINAVATQLLGVKPGALQGKQVKEAAAGNDLLRELIHDLDAEQDERSKQPLKIFAEGRESYFTKEIQKVTAVATGETEVKHIGYVIVVKNITQFREMDLAKTNFIATVSHELKTPISSIKLGLSILEDQRVGKLNDEQEKLVESIHDETNRLLNITGELLKMAQVEMGKITLDIHAVSPDEIVDYAVKAITAQAQQKNVGIRLQVAGALPKVNADAEKSAWVLINLLSNAIRYSPGNSVVALSVTGKQSSVRFAVADQGKGVPPEYKDRIFEKFFRAPGIKTDGTGLGLAIAKDFIQSQNGEIGVESEPGKGSEFWFTLPCTHNV